jgi:hypothetical protein
MIAPIALSGSLSPFIGQNWAAHLRKRVAEGIRKAVLFSIGWGAVVTVALFVAAGPVAALFTEAPEVRRALEVYLRTIPVGYAFLATVAVTSAVFNAVDRAVRSTALSALRSLALALPAAWIGAQNGGLMGLCLGLVIASVGAALLGVHWMRGLLLPNGELGAASGAQLSLESAVAAMDEGVRSRAAVLLGEVAGLEDVQLRRVRGGLVGVYVGARELAHLHSDGRIDLPLPVEIGDNLVARGVCIPHTEHPDNGWYSHDAAAAPGPEGGTWVLRLAHVLYEMSYRGPEDPVTRAELDAFTMSDACVAAMSAAATRWGLRLEQPSRDLRPA